MADSTRPDSDLALLTAALNDPGTDLRDVLTVVVDNLTAVVPSFVGVTITVVSTRSRSPSACTTLTSR